MSVSLQQPGVSDSSGVRVIDNSIYAECGNAADGPTLDFSAPTYMYVCNWQHCENYGGRKAALV